MIFFILEYLNQNLSKFLIQIREKYKEQIYFAFKNFIQILKIWKDYYNFRTKDSSFLQNITNIPFNTFLFAQYGHPELRFVLLETRAS